MMNNEVTGNEQQTFPITWAKCNVQSILANGWRNKQICTGDKREPATDGAKTA